MTIKTTMNEIFIKNKLLNSQRTSIELWNFCRLVDSSVFEVNLLSVFNGEVTKLKHNYGLLRTPASHQSLYSGVLKTKKSSGSGVSSSSGYINGGGL